MDHREGSSRAARCSTAPARPGAGRCAGPRRPHRRGRAGPACLTVAEFDASGAVVTPGFIDTHAHTDPQVFWDPAIDPDPLHGVTTMLVGNCSLSLYPVSTPPEARSPTSSPTSRTCRATSSTTASPGHGPTTPATATRSTRPAPASTWPPSSATARSASPSWAPTPGPGSPPPRSGPAMADLLERGHGRRRPGACRPRSSTSTPTAGRCRRGRADAAEVDALLDVIAAAGRGLVEIVPALLDRSTPKIAARRPGPALRGPRHPAHLDRLHLLRQQSGRHPAAGSTWPASFKSEGIGFYPQLSPRTVDFRLNWDSSMMFMSMPQGWHKVIAARGDEKAAAAAGPGLASRGPGRVGPGREGLFPTAGLNRCASSRCTGRQRALARTHAGRPGRRTGRPPVRRLGRLRRWPTTAIPASWPWAWPTPTSTGVGRTLADPAVLISSSDAGAHMQMLCASGDTTLVLTRHVRERGDFTLRSRRPRADRPAGRGVRLHGRGVDRAGQRSPISWSSPWTSCTTTTTSSSTTCPATARACAGPRAAIAPRSSGRPVQLDGKLTGELPGPPVIGSDEEPPIPVISQAAQIPAGPWAPRHRRRRPRDRISACCSPVPLVRVGQDLFDEEICAPSPTGSDLRPSSSVVALERPSPAPVERRSGTPATWPRRWPPACSMSRLPELGIDFSILCISMHGLGSGRPHR